MDKIISLILAGISVGLGNFAASIAIGLGGVSRSLRLKIAIVFGLFETGMPIVGLLVGHQIANKLGGHSNLIGGGLLVTTGVYLIISSSREKDDDEVKKASGSIGNLLLAGLSLSIDNLTVGFSLGTRNEPVVLAAVIIGLTSVILALLGLELGNRLNKKVEGYSGVLSGIILLFIGLAIIFNIL